MADEERIAITAIRDMNQEGFIAASLQRSGWKVIYRATSPAVLQERLPEFPSALVLSSDDFGYFEVGQSNRLIELRGRSQPSGGLSQLDPRSDFEVEEIIRSHATSTISTHIPATTAKVTTVASIGGRSGATSVAITSADYLSQRGSSLILVEGNRLSPRIAYHFQIHNIREEIARTQYGFSISEATDLESLHSFAHEADNFDEIVLDLGSATMAQVGGRRAEDLLGSWSNNSRARILLTARDDEKSKGEISQFVLREQSLRQVLDLTVILLPSKLLNRRERKKLIDERSDIYGVPVEVISRDPRAIEKMELAHSTLTFTSPKSQLLRDIAPHLERGRYS